MCPPRHLNRSCRIYSNEPCISGSLTILERLWKRRARYTSGMIRSLGRGGFGGGILLAICLAIAGCGGSGGTQPAAGGTPSSSQNQLLSYARCLRAHGIQVPDPDPANPTQLNIPKSALSDAAALDSAEQACRKYGGKLISGSGGTQGASSREVQLAQCLRKHGIAVADPQPGQSLTLPPGTSTQSASAAIAACSKSGSASGTSTGSAG